MAETIKGINIVMGAETTGLSKALTDVNKKSRDIQSELKQVERLLKFDPSNTELLAQKQKLLSNAIENSKEKLDRLRSAQEQVNQQFQRGEISEGQYRAFQREVAAAEQELKRFEDRIPQVEKKANDLGETFKGVGDKIGGIGEKISIGVTAPIVGITALATEGTKELRTELAKLDTNAKVAGENMDVLNNAMRELEAVTGETDSNVEGLSNLLAAGFKGEQMTQAMEAVAGAAIKFKDTLKFEGIADGLQETLATGAAIGPFAELLDRSGISLDTFNAGLKEAIANGTQQQYVLDILAKNGLPQIYQEYMKNNQALTDNAKANYDLQQSLANLGDTLQPIINNILPQITSLVQSFNELDEGTKKVIIAIGGIVAVGGPVLVAIGSIISAITTIVPVISGAATVIAGAISAPIAIIAALVAAVVAAGIAIVTHWDEIKLAAGELANTIAQAWDSLKASTIAAWEAIKTFVVEAFQWLYDHNYYFQDLVDFISEAWAKVSEVTAVVWSTIKDWLTGLWNNIKNTVVTTWNSILTTITGVLDKVKAAFQGLVDSAFSWGKNLMGEFIDGFKSMWDSLTSALESAAEQVAGFLGFHSPTKLGPGRDADKWAPNLVNMFAQGIEDSLPRLQSALGEMAVNLNPGSNTSAINNYNSGGNTIVLNVTEGWDQIERELRRRGVRL